MIADLLMATRTDKAGDVESEPIVVLLDDDGRVRLKLDDGERIDFDLDELLAIVVEERHAEQEQAA